MRVLRLLLPLAVALVCASPAFAADCPGADLMPGAADPVAIRAATVCLTNAERAQNGLAALVPEGRLEAAGQAYSQELVDQHFFAHVAPDGAGLLDRLRAYVKWSRVGENLAWGEDARATPRAIVAAWMASPEHRANILMSAYTEIGIGVVPGTPAGSPGASGTYAAEYGTRVSDSPPWPVEGAAPAAPPTPVPVSVAAAKPAAGAKHAVAGTKAARARARAPHCRRGSVARRVRVHGRRITRCARRSQPSRSRSAASVLQKAKSS